MNKFILFPLATMLLSCGGAPASSSNESSALSSDVPHKIEYSIPEDKDLVDTINANAEQYDVLNVSKVPNHPLEGKTIYWLGSSVTYGASSAGQAVADFLAAKSGCISKKEAVSGTTLFNDGKTKNTGELSYVSRLLSSKAFDEHNDAVDAFVCQISTNDCTNDRLDKRGVMTAEDNFDLESFDTATTLGAVEYIIGYVVEHFDCPVFFYSGSYFSDGSNGKSRQNNNPKGSEYGKLVSSVKDIAAKWDKRPGTDVRVIDLYNDQDFNAAASDKYYGWAMNDPIHPKKAGYLQWWTPYFEDALCNEIG